MKKKQAEMVYCKQLMVNVDLRQGFGKCIEKNQCFSDDSCPFSQKFHQPPAQTDGAAPMTATPNSSSL
ncbi:hypothetical protein BH10PSE16_BH10PSE16_13180 [soil metagenome]